MPQEVINKNLLVGCATIICSCTAFFCALLADIPLAKMISYIFGLSGFFLFILYVDLPQLLKRTDFDAEGLKEHPNKQTQDFDYRVINFWTILSTFSVLAIAILFRNVLFQFSLLFLILMVVFYFIFLLSRRALNKFEEISNEKSPTSFSSEMKQKLLILWVFSLLIGLGGLAFLSFGIFLTTLFMLQIFKREQFLHWFSIRMLFYFFLDYVISSIICSIVFYHSLFFLQLFIASVLLPFFTYWIVRAIHKRMHNSTHTADKTNGSTRMPTFFNSLKIFFLALLFFPFSLCIIYLLLLLIPSTFLILLNLIIGFSMFSTLLVIVKVGKFFYSTQIAKYLGFYISAGSSVFAAWSGLFWLFSNLSYQYSISLFIFFIGASYLALLAFNNNSCTHI